MQGGHEDGAGWADTHSPATDVTEEAVSDAPEVGPTDIIDPQLALATLLHSSVIVGIHPDQVRPAVSKLGAAAPTGSTAAFGRKLLHACAGTQAPGRWAGWHCCLVVGWAEDGSAEWWLLTQPPDLGGGLLRAVQPLHVQLNFKGRVCFKKGH